MAYTMDPASEARLAQVFPVLADRIRLLAQGLASGGILIRVVQGLRTWGDQDDLYAQGRTAPGKIVTNCPGGCSYHNFGLAVDIVPSDRGPGQPYAPDWNPQHPDWRKMVDAAEALGLNCGADWRTFKDWPHAQLIGRFPIGQPSEELKQIYREGGFTAVWQAVEQSLPPSAPPEDPGLAIDQEIAT